MTWRIKKICWIILMTCCHGNNLRWPQNYLKSLKLQSHCMQINFIFTVCTNIMLSSLLPRMLWLLCFSFILLYYLHFMLVKRIPIIFQISIKLKQISPSTNRLVNRDQYIHKQHANFQDSTFTQSRALGFYNWKKGVKVRMWENTHEKKEKHLTWYESLWHLTHYTY